MTAYQEMLQNATSTPHAPWYIIPADHKWFTHLAVTSVISDTLDRLGLSFPAVSSEDMKDLLASKRRDGRRRRPESWEKKEERNKEQKAVKMPLL